MPFFPCASAFSGAHCAVNTAPSESWWKCPALGGRAVMVAFCLALDYLFISHSQALILAPLRLSSYKPCCPPLMHTVYLCLVLSFSRTQKHMLCLYFHSSCPAPNTTTPVARKPFGIIFFLPPRGRCLIAHLYISLCVCVRVCV